MSEVTRTILKLSAIGAVMAILLLVYMHYTHSPACYGETCNGQPLFP